MNTAEAAKGRWPEILAALGVPDAWLSKKQTACPFCEKKKYRFADLHGSGIWFCGGTSGNPFVLLKEKRGWDFRESARRIDELLGRKGVWVDNSEREKLAARLNKMWDEAVDKDIVPRYLHRRGLSHVPSCLRGHPGLSFRSDSGLVSQAPAMLAQITDIDGKHIGIHRTFLLESGNKIKQTTPILGTRSGAAIRLYTVGKTLGIAEGIETAIACHQMYEIPVWSSICADGMASIKIPDAIKNVHIYSDNDANFVGQAAAHKLAQRLVLGEKRNVEVHVPPTVGTDWLDVLNERKGK